MISVVTSVADIRQENCGRPGNEYPADSMARWRGCPSRHPSAPRPNRQSRRLGPSATDLPRVVESATGHPLVLPTSKALTHPRARFIVGIWRPFPRQLRLPIGDYCPRFHVKGEKVIVDKIDHRGEFYEE